MEKEPPDELPEASGGKCIDCKVPLFFRPADKPDEPAGFICKKCGRRYRGAKEWDV